MQNYLKVRGLKISGNKNKLVTRIFSAIENNFMLVKTAFEVEERFKERS